MFGSLQESVSESMNVVLRHPYVVLPLTDPLYPLRVGDDPDDIPDLLFRVDVADCFSSGGDREG